MIRIDHNNLFGQVATVLFKDKMLRFLDYNILWT